MRYLIIIGFSVFIFFISKSCDSGLIKEKCFDFTKEEISPELFSQVAVRNWKYHYSFMDDSCWVIDKELEIPRKMNFVRDSTRSANLIVDKKVSKTLKEKLISDIYCETYNDNNFIDTYLIRLEELANKNTIKVHKVGKKYKYYYYLKKLSKDTLILEHEKVFMVNGQEYYNVKHLYTSSD